MEQIISDLTHDDISRLREQLAVVNHFLEQNYENAPRLTEEPSDLDLLQAILDDGILAADQTYELQCLGVALGAVMSKHLGLKWVAVEDEYGRDPALRYANSSIIIYPLTMISKRVEREGEVDVFWLFNATREHIEQVKSKVQ